jgi:hypothetical protein
MTPRSLPRFSSRQTWFTRKGNDNADNPQSIPLPEHNGRGQTGRELRANGLYSRPNGEPPGKDAVADAASQGDQLAAREAERVAMRRRAAEWLRHDNRRPSAWCKKKKPRAGGRGLLGSFGGNSDGRGCPSHDQSSDPGLREHDRPVSVCFGCGSFRHAPDPQWGFSRQRGCLWLVRECQWSVADGGLNDSNNGLISSKNFSARARPSSVLRNASWSPACLVASLRKASRTAPRRP